MSGFETRVRRLTTLLENSAPSLAGFVDDVSRAIVAAFRAGGKVLVFGNGGSASDASHFAAEFVGRFLREREGWPALALSPEAAVVTAVGNDYGFERVFSRQISALGVAGDIAIGISTSGRSKNVLAALEVARAKGLVTAALTGADGLAPGSIAVEYLARVDSKITYEIQEVHKVVLHSICDEVERRMTGEGSGL